MGMGLCWGPRDVRPQTPVRGSTDRGTRGSVCCTDSQIAHRNLHIEMDSACFVKDSQSFAQYNIVYECNSEHIVMIQITELLELCVSRLLLCFICCHVEELF